MMPTRVVIRNSMRRRLSSLWYSDSMEYVRQQCESKDSLSQEWMQLYNDRAYEQHQEAPQYDPETFVVGEKLPTLEGVSLAQSIPEWTDDEVLTDMLTSAAEKLSAGGALQQDRVLLQECGQYFTNKLYNTIDTMPWRIQEDHTKDSAWYKDADGREAPHSSREVAVLYALRVLNGSFDGRLSRADDIIVRKSDRMEEVLEGMHRYAALQLLGIAQNSQAREVFGVHITDD